MAAAATHDIVIVGGGIAGLTVASELASRGRDVLLLEYYPKFGGRIATFRDPEVGQYEIGAGRIFHKHKRVHALIEKYKLHTFPISSTTQFEKSKNNFNELFEPLRRVFETLDPEFLATHTIKDCVPSYFAPILEQFPYRGETELMRADLALSVFKPTEPMGAAGAPEFVGIVEGIDSLITHIENTARKAGAILKSRHRVEDIRYGDDDGDELFEITGKQGKKASETPFTYTAKHVILATCRCSLGKFNILHDAPFLKHLATSPLTRIYAKFPKNAADTVWFKDIEKTITANPLRYVIPINSETGLIMISYTDGKDTVYWNSFSTDEELENAILKHTRELFPDKNIPKPTYLQKHYWSGGCTYWLPGTYNIEKVIDTAMNPSTNLYVVGESISNNQAWIEGALESAERFLEKYFTKIE